MRYAFGDGRIRTCVIRRHLPECYLYTTISCISVLLYQLIDYFANGYFCKMWILYRLYVGSNIGLQNLVSG